MQTIAILGSTGSIGTQALELVRLHPEEFRVVALTARSSREKLFEQVREFRPEVAGLTEPIPMSEIPEDVRFCRWVMGEEALRVAAAGSPGGHGARQRGRHCRAAKRDGRAGGESAGAAGEQGKRW